MIAREGLVPLLVAILAAVMVMHFLGLLPSLALWVDRIAAAGSVQGPGTRHSIAASGCGEPG